MLHSEEIKLKTVLVEFQIVLEEIPILNTTLSLNGDFNLSYKELQLEFFLDCMCILYLLLLIYVMYLY